MDHPMDAVAHPNDVEVQQQADWQLTESQVRQQLRAMQRQDTLDCFEFDDDTAFDDEVQTITGLEMNISVDNRQSNLRVVHQAGSFDFVPEASPVRTFQKSWPKLVVHNQGGADDPFGHFFMNQHYVGSASSVSSAVAIYSQAEGHRSWQ